VVVILSIVVADLNIEGFWRGDTRWSAGKDVAAHRILSSVTSSWSGWCHSSPWFLQSKLFDSK